MTNNNTNNGLAIQANGTELDTSGRSRAVVGQSPTQLRLPVLATGGHLTYSDLAVAMTNEYLGLETLLLNQKALEPLFQTDVECSVGARIDHLTPQSVVFDHMVADALFNHGTAVAHRTAKAKLETAKKRNREWRKARESNPAVVRLTEIRQTLRSLQTSRVFQEMPKATRDGYAATLQENEREQLSLVATYDAEHPMPHPEEALQKLKDDEEEAFRTYRAFARRNSPPRDDAKLKEALTNLGIGSICQTGAMRWLRNSQFTFVVIGSTEPLRAGTLRVMIPFQEVVVPALNARNVPQEGARFVSFFPSTERGIPGADVGGRKKPPTFLVIDRTLQLVIIIPGTIVANLLRMADRVRQDGGVHELITRLYPHPSHEEYPEDLKTLRAVKRKLAAAAPKLQAAGGTVEASREIVEVPQS